MMRTGLALLATLALAAPAAAQTKITFATDWKAQAEHGGFYQAVAEGLYAKYGLDVTIRPGGPGTDNQQLIAAGAVDMAMGSNNFFGLNLVRAGAPVRAVMASFQKDPQILMAHQRPDVKSLADLKGKPILLADASINGFWVWLKVKYGYTDAQIRKYTFNMAPWLVDKNAVQQGYVSSEPFLVKKEGVEPQVFLLADSGYPSYATMVLVPQKMIDERPQQVQAFVNATIEGWYGYMYGDRTKANALIKKDNPEMTDDTMAFGHKSMIDYGVVDSGDARELGIGAMTEARWKEFSDIMIAEKVYPADLDWRKAYTLAFINKKHGIELRK